MLRIKFLLTAIVVCFTVSLVAQLRSGVIYDDAGVPIVFADIVLLSQNNKALASTVTNSQGEFEISTIDGSHILRVSYLGYEDNEIHLDSIDTSDRIILYLKRKNFNLEEVQVSGQRTSYKINGDTTSYHLDHYKKETDRNLGDVLRKLEGLDVSKEGTISFEGKQIDKILIEGKDIMNDQHKLTVESLSPRDIKKIQIIQQYRPFHEQFSKKWSDKVAMNIVLTEEAKIKINGDVQVGGGVDRKYESKANLYTANSKIGYSGFFRSNNLGDQTLTANDFLNMQSSLSRTLNKIDGDLEKIIPLGLRTAEDIQGDLDNLLAFNIEYSNPQKKSSTRLSTLNNLTRQTGDARLTQIFTQNSSLLKGDRTKKQNLLYHYSVFNHKIKLSDIALIEIDLPMDILTQKAINNYTGLFENNVPVNSHIDHDTKNYKINPNIYYSKEVNSNMYINVESGFLLEGNANEMTINSVSSLFDTSTNMLHQRVDKEVNEFHLSARLDYSTTKARMGVELKTERQELNWLMTDLYKQGESLVGFNAHVQGIRPAIWLGYNSKKVRIEPTVDFNIFSVDVPNKKTHYNIVNPSLLFKYSFSKFKFFLLKAKYKSDIYPIQSNSSLVEIIDNTTLRNYTLNGNTDIQKTQLVSLSYVNINIANKSRWNTLFSYSKSYDGLYTSAETYQNFVILNNSVAEWTKTILFDTKLAKRIMSNRLIVSPSINYRRNEIVAISNLDFITRSMILKVTSNLDGAFNFSASLKYTDSEQKTDLFTSNFDIWEQNVAIDYHLNKFKIHLNGNYFSRMNDNTNSKFLIFNIEVNYHFSSSWTFYINGRDLFNIDKKQVSNFGFTQYYIEQIDFLRFPGSIVVGAVMKL